jgi:hypothetical protein
VLNNDIPANQIALATTFKAIARGRPKTLKQHLADAEMVMTELRERGFRLVPFPPLKTRNKRGGRKLK